MKKLSEQAREYLDTHRGEWCAIAQVTDIDVQWIYKFMGLKIADPGVSKVEKILCHRDGTLDRLYPNCSAL